MQMLLNAHGKPANTSDTCDHVRGAQILTIFSIQNGFF